MLYSGKRLFRVRSAINSTNARASFRAERSGSGLISVYRPLEDANGPIRETRLSVLGFNQPNLDESWKIR